MTLTDILKETRLLPLGIDKKRLHLERLAQVTKNASYINQTFFLTKEEVQPYTRQDYTWIVGEKFVQRFPYAASIHPNYSVKIKTSSSIYALVYQGDIPDFAIYRIEQARENGLPYTTIHSTQKLPIEEIELRPIDPVIIAWPHCPDIRQTKHNRLYSKIMKRPSVQYTLRDQQWGFVIAAWDNDKEIEL